LVSGRIRLKKRVFFAPDTGFAVFTALFLESGGIRTVVGTLTGVHEGDLLQIEGEESAHPRFGNQVRITKFEALPPEDKEGIVRYLSSGRIKGVGKKTARKIVDRFGGSTLDILEKSPESLQEVHGLRRTVIENVQRIFLENKVIRDLTIRLSPFGIGPQTTNKIYSLFGDRSLDTITHNPYLLIERIRGISFRIADRIGRALDTQPGDPHRLRAGIIFLMDQAESQNGDLYVPEAELLRKAVSLLGVAEEDIREQIAVLTEQERLFSEPVGGDPVLALPLNALQERLIADRLRELAGSGPPDPQPVIHFANLFERLDLELSAEQQEAVVSAVHQRLAIITGGPGTGKTTIIRALLEIFHDNHREVALAAPTGRAAKRIEESSGMSASTIHRLLKINPQTGTFTHNRSHPLRCDALIVDEFSMVDTFLFHSLLQALPDQAQLIIIGDCDQLPPVGPGNVLRDLIASGHLPIISLSRNFRQEESGLIVENAYRVIRGDPPLVAPYRDDLDFVLLTVAHDGEALQKIESICSHYQEEYGHASPDFQILIPMYRGEAGIDRINQLIQERFNPEPFLLQSERLRLKKGDKIMQVRNNYEKEVFNGDLGRVAGYDARSKTLIADFDGRRVDYPNEELDELTLAYAVSIHKSQGSEYELVVVVLLPAHAVMFSRQLLYTAITRAKKRLILISDKRTILRACRASKPQLRRTLLPLRLRERFGPGPADAMV